MDVAGILARAPASARTIGSASRAGSRRAEQASWLRTSTSGSIAARRASAAATAGETCRPSHEQPRRPEPDVRVGMIERLQGRRLVQPADQVQGPERLEGESGPSCSSISRFSSGTTDAILAIADQPEGRLARPPVGIRQPLDQLGA